MRGFVRFLHTPLALLLSASSCPFTPTPHHSLPDLACSSQYLPSFLSCLMLQYPLTLLLKPWVSISWVFTYYCHAHFMLIMIFPGTLIFPSSLVLCFLEGDVIRVPEGSCNRAVRGTYDQNELYICVILSKNK